MRIKHKLLFILCFFLLAGLKSQISQSAIIDKVNAEDLTNPLVSALFQDQKGYLWVGTIGGLNKYDGYRFTKYRFLQNDSNSLSNSSIVCFHQTENDIIFVGTRNGLNIYNYNSNNFKRVLVDAKENNFLQKNTINCIVSNKTDEKIVGTNDGILKYNAQKNKLETIAHGNTLLLKGWSVKCMCIDRLGNLWMAAKNNDPNDGKNSVFKYNFSTDQLFEINVIEKYASDLTGISEDYLGNIWVALYNGLASINPSNLKFTYYIAPENFYSNVAYTHTKDNVIWQSYWSFGLTAFDIDKKEFKIYRNDPDNEKSLISNKCWALLKDDNDILWIGSDVGLQKITSKRPAIEVIRRNNRNSKSSFKGNIVVNVLASKTHNDIVYAGIDGEGFSIYDRGKKQSANFGPNSEIKNDERFVNQFIEETNGDLYVLGQNNFQKISFSSGNPAARSYFGYQEHYSACGIQDPQNPNKLWLGGKAEVFYFDKISQQFTFFKNPLEITNVFYSAFLSGKYIYFGHKNGLLKVDPESRELEKIDLPEVGNIKNAVKLNDDEILLSSQYFGLIKFFPKTNKFEIVYKSKNEFFSEPYFIFKYKTNSWLAGNDGLTCWNPTTGEITQITTEDGLPSNIVHRADVRDGYFYLATQEGLVIINPDFQTSHFITPKVDVTEFVSLADNKLYENISNGAELILTEKQNSFRINFTVLDFNLPEKNRFKFKLSPIETEWQTPAGDNFLIFNSLPPGDYKFELLGSNADQIWSIEPFVINIKIVPPFYKTSWFLYLCASILILSGLTFFYLRLRSNRLKQLMLEKIIKERTAEIQAQKAELMDSIIYAERIQKAIFVGENILSDNLAESFIFYKPKDKVSGDFYWIGKHKEHLIVFAGDCTGHGVPGAMLSIVGTSLMNKIVYEENSYLPGEILTRLNYLFYNQLSLKADNIRDGMDACVITINLATKSAYFSAAKLDAVSIVNNSLFDLRAQRHSIGDSDSLLFTTQTIPFEENRFIYLLSDGIKDQYGGPNKKKFSAKRFKEIIVEASFLPITEQKEFINKTIMEWKADYAQTDDMIVIGLKF